jgi:hypothetical protein
MLPRDSVYGRFSMSALQELSLEDLRAHAVETFRQGGGTRPEVVLVQLGDETAVLKDYAFTDTWYRRFVAGFASRRELRALHRLQGIPGVPKVLRVLGSDAFLMEYLSGRIARGYRYRDNPPELIPEVFFPAAENLLNAMHDRGIAHCDLRSRGNLLVTPEATPVALDFVAHYHRGARWNILDRWLFNRFCDADYTALARLKLRHAPHLLTEVDRAGLARDKKSGLERAARIFGKSTRWLVKTLLTSEKPQKK